MVPLIFILFVALIGALWFLLAERKGLRVLMYHKVSDSHTDFLTVTEAQLSSQLEYIRQKGYNIISLSDCLAYLHKGTALPKKPLLLTFDDGYKNNIVHAYPVLKQYEAKATVFIVPFFVGKTVLYDGAEQTFMSVPELQAMRPLLEYAWHSFRHDNYAELTAEEVSADIKACKDLMSASGLTIQAALAYPYGAYPKKNKEAQQTLFTALEQENIRAAFRIGNRINTLPLRNKFLVQRLDIRGDESFAVFKRKLRLGKLF